MIDLSCETLLTLSQAARLRPPSRGGRPTHPSTLYRWISRGLRGHKLEGIRLGGTTYTSREALQRFGERLTSGPSPAAAAAGADRRQQRAEAVDEELSRFGF
jgi:hypothetical protein